MSVCQLNKDPFICLLNVFYNLDFLKRELQMTLVRVASSQNSQNFWPVLARVCVSFVWSKEPQRWIRKNKFTHPYKC